MFVIVFRSDEDIIDATMKELERLFPTEIKADQSLAKVRASNWYCRPRILTRYHIQVLIVCNNAGCEFPGESCVCCVVEAAVKCAWS